MWLWILGVGVSCGTASTESRGPTSEDPADSGDDLPSAWAPGLETEPEAPELAVVEATLQEALDLTWWWDPTPLLQTYEALLSYRHEDCIDYRSTTVDNTTFFQWSGKGACGAEGSHSFVGQSWGWTGEGMEFDDMVMWPDILGYVPGTEWSIGGLAVGGQAYVLTEDGQRFNMSGQYAQLELTSNDGLERHWVRQLSGVSQYEGDCATLGEWACEVNSLDWNARLVNEDDRTLTMTLSGGVGPLPESGGTVATDELVLVDLAEGATDKVCELEPAGTITVRSSDGSWAQVRFDGEDPEGCDGCGEVTWNDEEIGEVCLSVTPALDVWDGPW